MRWRGSKRLETNFTMYPNDLLDEVKPTLTRAEAAVLDRIVRHTYGWQKPEGARIALSILVRETSLNESSVTRAIVKLIDANVIQRLRIQSPEKGNEPSFYSLVFEGEDAPTQLPLRASPQQAPVVRQRKTTNKGSTKRKVSGPTSSSPDVEEDSGTTHARVSKKQGLDWIKDALVEACGFTPASPQEWGPFQKAASHIHEWCQKQQEPACSEPEGLRMLVQQRYRNLSAQWPDITITPTALAKHWGRAGNGKKAAPRNVGNRAVDQRDTDTSAYATFRKVGG